MPVLGVSIAVPDPDGSRLQRYRTELPDPEGPLIPAHVTLVPPTEVAEADLPAVREHLAATAGAFAAFRLGLHGTGTFRPTSAVVFVEVVQGRRDCARLAEALRSGPLAGPEEYPYHPHVTLAHDVAPELLDRAAAELARFRSDFEVDAFWLYRRGPDRHWTPDRAFELRS